MSSILSIWWVWIAIALILGLVELLVPSFIFLGFSLGAVVTAALVGLGYAPSLPVALALFACVSLLAWVGLRFVFRNQSSGARIVRKDINDD